MVNLGKDIEGKASQLKKSYFVEGKAQESFIAKLEYTSNSILTLRGSMVKIWSKSDEQLPRYEFPIPFLNDFKHCAVSPFFPSVFA